MFFLIDNTLFYGILLFMNLGRYTVTDIQLASLILAGPCLILCGIWLIGMAYVFGGER